MTNRRGWFALIIVVLFLDGCGGQAATSQVRSVVKHYYAAVEAGHRTRACALYTAAAREEIAREQYETCTAALSGSSGRKDFHLLGLAGLSRRIDHVSVNGDRATVYLTWGFVHSKKRVHRHAQLVKTPGGWRISKSLIQVLIIR